MSPSAHAASDSAHRGRHICLPFETESEKEAAVLSFIHEGLAHGKRCLFVGTRAEYEQLGLHLEEEGICSLRAESRGALIFSTPEEEYLTNGGLRPERACWPGSTATSGRPWPTVSPASARPGELMNVPSDETLARDRLVRGADQRKLRPPPLRRPLPLSADGGPAEPGSGRPAHPPRRGRARGDLRQPVLRAPRRWCSPTMRRPGSTGSFASFGSRIGCSGACRTRPPRP